MILFLYRHLGIWVLCNYRSWCWFLDLSWLGGSFVPWFLVSFWIIRVGVCWVLPVLMDCLAGVFMGSDWWYWKLRWGGRGNGRSVHQETRIERRGIFPWYPGKVLWFTVEIRCGGTESGSALQAVFWEALPMDDIISKIHFLKYVKTLLLCFCLFLFYILLSMHSVWEVFQCWKKL